MNESLTDALVKLRHRMQGKAVTLAPLEARALYMAILRHATPEQIADTQWAEQARAGRENVGLTSDPWGVAVREATAPDTDALVARSDANALDALKRALDR